MKLLEPFEIGDAEFVSSNVAETDPEYDAGATYAALDVVRDEATHHRFESQAGGNIGHALTDLAYWVDLGPTPRWAMFDRKLGTVTENGETIDTTTAVAGRVGGIALFGLEAATVQLIGTDAIDGEIYNETFSTVSQENVDDIYDYFFAPILRRPNFYVDGLPPYSGAQWQLIISQPGGTARCSNAVFGFVNDLGGTEWGSEYGNIDYSKADEDPFGGVDLSPGINRPTIRGSAEIDPVLVDEVIRVLNDRRGKPTVYIVSERYSSGLIYGWARDRRVQDDVEPFAILHLDLESLS